jgi:hypothetical protein
MRGAIVLQMTRKTGSMSAIGISSNNALGNPAKSKLFIDLSSQHAYYGPTS